MRTLATVATLALATLTIASPTAGAATLGFDCTTAPVTSTACTIGENQLSVEVLAGSGAQSRRVGFAFRNIGSAASAISEIYFDDGTLLAQSSIFNSPGVNFVAGANPGDLPGGNSINPAFNVTQNFLAEASSPPPANGVGPGEAVTIYYTLQGGQTMQDTLDSLASGALRVGVHVIGFANGASASFVNNPVPLAGALLLLGSALLGAGATAWRRVATPRGPAPSVQYQ